MENAKEFLLVMKTTGARLGALQKQVARLHTYEVPEFLVLDVTGGSSNYLRWLHKSVYK